MTITIGRKTLIILSLLFLILVASLIAYRSMMGSTNAAIRHAEAFIFRRMSVSQLSEQGLYRFFVATNRAGDIDGSSDSQREPGLRFGQFDSEVQPTLGLGMLINPTEWFQNEEIRLTGRQALSREELAEALRQQVAASPHRGLLIVIHGFREAFPSALRKTVFIGHVLDLDAPVLLFDWPGNQGTTLRGYQRARAVADESGAELAELLRFVSEEVQPDSLWVLANSLGGQVVTSAFAQLHEGEKQLNIEDVVLTAPDIDREDFDARFRDKISEHAENLTVYVSSNDRALLMSRLVNRAARGGESTLATDQLDEAIRVMEMTHPDDEQVTLVDVTPVNRTRNFHNFSLETPEFFDDLFLRLTNDSTPSSRPLYRVTTPEDRVYWVLTRGR